MNEISLRWRRLIYDFDDTNTRETDDTQKTKSGQALNFKYERNVLINEQMYTILASRFPSDQNEALLWLLSSSI